MYARGNPTLLRKKWGFYRYIYIFCIILAQNQILFGVKKGKYQHLSVYKGQFLVHVILHYLI